MKDKARKKNLNEAVIKTFFSNVIQDGTMTLSFSRRDIIEGYMTGKLPHDDLVSNLDLHSPFIGVEVKFFKKNGVVTHSKQNYISIGAGNV